MTAISFRLLGPLEVAVSGRPVSLGGTKPRTVLAALLLDAGVTVSTDTLADVLWPDRPPRSAAANIRTYVHLLRRSLVKHDGGLATRVEGRPGGYVLHAEPEEIDQLVFEAHVAAAHRSLDAGDRDRALTSLTAADALWRGPVLADLVHGHTWGSPVARLTEARAAAQELRTRVRIELGQYGDAVAELRGLLAEDPLREQRWAQLVLALDAAGRRAEALTAYTDAERVLRDELDAEPGPQLRQIRSSLASVPVAAAADPHVRHAPGGPVAELVPVCQLPLDLPDFTGRDAVVDRLVDLLRTRTRTRHGKPSVVVVSGAPGVGKSAIAVRVAHEVRSDFPDSQLHIDLGGTTNAPRQPLDVLTELLRALGVPDAATPRTVGDRAALLRSRLAATRVLIVLEDAGDAAQVRPLLPGAGGSAVLVTSRMRLLDVAGAHPVELDVLPLDEAAGLLTGIIGAARVTPEPDGATAILESCGYLPLAIRVAGAKLANRPNWTLRMYADRLADEHRLLDELRVGDLAVRASVTLSYDQLSTTAARAFRGLGSLGPVHFPAWVVAALLGRPEADDVLDVLVDAHLVDLVSSDGTGQPRYRLHDLLRVYAAEQAEPTAQRDAAVRRVLEGYLALAVAAAERMSARFFGVVQAQDRTGSWRPDELDALLRDPVAWFEAETRTAVAAVALAAEWGHDDLAWRIAAAFTPYFDLRGLHDDCRRTHVIALAAARRTGDERGQAIVSRNLGQVHVYHDAYTEALASFDSAHQLFGRVGDEHGAAIALTGALTALRIRGEHDKALDRGREALSLFTRTGDRHREAAVRLGVGSVHLDRGEHDLAERWFTDALVLAEAIGDRHREAHALHKLAMLHQHRGHLDKARAQLDVVIAIFDELGDDNCAGYAHQSLGEVYLRSGDLAYAQVLLVNSLAVYRRNGDRRSQAVVSELLGELNHESRRPKVAQEYFRAALALWRELCAGQDEKALVARMRRLTEPAGRAVLCAGEAGPHIPSPA